ncbi:MAG: TIGR01777 family protein [Crocinitomicaceae bacterium]|nr:MAG: TIGR01777 family protein [Crocinitomicaceae bacterium]
MENEVVLVAGGTGLIGQQIVHLFKTNGSEVRVLSRGKSNASKSIFHWDPDKKEIDKAALHDVTVIINLVGSGIAEKRWTASRKKEIIDSRVQPTLFLASLAPEISTLKQYVSASGINCYDTSDSSRIYNEEDAFGTDFLSTVVQQWEKAADAFLPYCKVAKVRISMVLAAHGGALETIIQPMKYGFTSAFGTGKQWMPWIHINDLARVFEFIVANQLTGSFNATGKVVSNEKFTQVLAATLGKKKWLPNVPSFVLKFALGEMSTVVLDGVYASSEKLKNLGFNYAFEELESALTDLRGRR